VKIFFALVGLAACLYAQAPDYSAAGIVNGANFASGPLAPNMIVSLFGTGLSWADTGVAMGSDNMTGEEMPKKMADAQVFVANYPAHLYYVSKTQVNLVIPCYLRPGEMDFWLARDGWAGPKVQITVQSAAPVLFQTADKEAIATHLDGSLVTKDAPTGVGETIVLWATGLGCIQNQDAGDDGVRPAGPQWLCNMDQFSVSLGGTPVDHSLILYAGVAPGYPGLYQVNLKMPDHFPPDPEIRLAVGSSVSMRAVILHAR
jgi:uncharacterized protein (TIGR03437 family)